MLAPLLLVLLGLAVARRPTVRVDGLDLLDQVRPAFATQVRRWIAEDVAPALARESRITGSEWGLRIYSGLRSAAEQRALYDRGRSEPGRVVTDADGTELLSRHQLGVAIDWVPIRNGVAQWTALDVYDELNDLARRRGLRAGITLANGARDLGHLEDQEVST